MSNSEADSAFRVGALNICTGGTQIVNVYGASRGRFQIKPLFDDFGATTTTDAHGDCWSVTGTNGVGTIDLFSVMYNTAINTNTTTIWAKVYDHLNPQQSEVFSTTDCVKGQSTDGGHTFNWKSALGNALGNVSFSNVGVPHHVRVFKVTNNDVNDVTLDDTVAFLAVPSTGSGSSGGQILVAQNPLAHAPTLEMDVAAGPHAGRHILESISRMLWKITTGPLKGLIEFTAHSDTLTVSTPYGRRTFPISQTRPFSVVLPGELFGSKHDVVVCAP